MSILPKLLTAGRLAAGACALTLTSSPPNASARPPGKERKAPKGKDGPKDKEGPGPKGKEGPKHEPDLRRAYDLLTEGSVLSRPAGKKQDGPGPDGDGRRYYEAAKRVYLEAGKAADAEGPAAREFAVAAHDAARGLKHRLAASLPADPGLPRPPGGPPSEESWGPARAELQRAKDRLEEAGAAGGPAGKDFRDAARKTYADARAAYEAKEYEKAAGLARGAEAWSQVGEHLDRAKVGGPRGEAEKVPPPPEPKKDRGPGPKPAGKDAPPPPPPLGEKGSPPPPPRPAGRHLGA